MILILKYRLPRKRNKQKKTNK